MIFNTSIQQAKRQTQEIEVLPSSTQTHSDEDSIPVSRRPAYRVLIVEDDPHIGRLLLVNLNRAGLDARLALDGEAGLQSFHAQPPHLVLLDLMMPIMDGFQVCEKIRAEITVPIVIMTARLEPVHRMRGFRLGADDYVLKPFDPQLLVARIIAHLRRVYRYDNGAIRRKDVPDPLGQPPIVLEDTEPKTESRGRRASDLQAHLPDGWALCQACHYMAPPAQFPRRFTTPQSAVVACPNCGELGRIQFAKK
jgi:DNA-binding response OmpR family regulator